MTTQAAFMKGRSYNLSGFVQVVVEPGAYIPEEDIEEALKAADKVRPWPATYLDGGPARSVGNWVWTLHPEAPSVDRHYVLEVRPSFMSRRGDLPRYETYLKCLSANLLLELRARGKKVVGVASRAVLEGTFGDLAR